jgi:hypothetical protein
MRYELKDGYVSKVFFGCHSGKCTLYEGIIPDGYETLEQWADNANIRAYKVVDGNLVFDAEEDARLQEEYKRDGKTVYEGKLIGGESTTLSNVKRFLDVYVTINYEDCEGTIKYTIDTNLGNTVFGGGMLTPFDEEYMDTYYVSESKYDTTTNNFTHNRIGYFSIANGGYTDRKNTVNYYVYRIDTYD